MRQRAAEALIAIDAREHKQALITAFDGTTAPNGTFFRLFIARGLADVVDASDRGFIQRVEAMGRAERGKREREFFEEVVAKMRRRVP